MSVEETYLLSSNELNLVAAASGMESFLMFFHPLNTSREQQIQSVFRLMNDGFLIGKGTTIEPGPSLIPLLKLLKQSSTVAIAKLSSCEAAPVCIYYDGIENFLRIVPHVTKKGFYEVGIVELDTLLEDLETLHFLPALRGRQIIDYDSTIDNQWDNEVSSVSVKEPPLSTFEKYDLTTKMLIGKTSIVQTPFAWCLTSGPIASTKYTCYSRHNFASWLKGALE